MQLFYGFYVKQNMTHLEKFNILDAKVKRLEKMRAELVSEIHHTVINHFEEVSGVYVGKVVKYKGFDGLIYDVLIGEIECSERPAYYDRVSSFKSKSIKKDGTFHEKEICLDFNGIIYENGFDYSIDYNGVKAKGNI